MSTTHVYTQACVTHVYTHACVTHVYTHACVTHVYTQACDTITLGVLPNVFGHDGSKTFEEERDCIDILSNRAAASADAMLSTLVALAVLSGNMRMSNMSNCVKNGLFQCCGGSLARGPLSTALAARFTPKPLAFARSTVD